MDTSFKSLDSSIPANNVKIIEIFNKLKNGQLAINKDYQRKLVWKRSHKYEFIDTILRNYPFPEVYWAPGSLDQEKLILIDEIVDGQQRLTTIQDYILEQDVFALPKVPIKRFTELSTTERSGFLNYEVSVRYLKNVDQAQVKEIFQRINRTDYSLNRVERLNAQWGESEFVCFAKQIIEEDFKSDNVEYKVTDDRRRFFLEFFHGPGDGDDSVFTDADRSRMLALQYVMTVVSTMDYGSYFPRSDRVQNYIQGFNDSFPQASAIEERLLRCSKFIASLNLERRTRWYNKANLFSLIVELDKTNVDTINATTFSDFLKDLDFRGTLHEYGALNKPYKDLTTDELKYLSFAQEAVNEKRAREYRGEFLRDTFPKFKKI
ncbi:hypothetical protein DBR42_25230 [Pelomonas sp. HMWF004]|nr:hypothetical protein DBR42_25230 [Pelomonas sp. HMWF004]